MTDLPVTTLLGAVRRRLWQGHFVAAARLALWGSTGLMLLAAAVHLAAARPVAAGAILSALALLWASMLAWAGSRRPTDSACALWADRHLDGASAFTTLLDIGQAEPGSVDAQALHWLEQWARARLPDSLRLLAERRQPARLTKALLCMLVCTALAVLVLALPDAAPPVGHEIAPSTLTGIAEPAAPDGELPAPAAWAKDIADALRSAPSRDAAERGRAGDAAPPGPGKTDEGGRPPTAQTNATPPGPRAGATQSSSGTAADAIATSGAATATGAGSGREAGDSRDKRADVGVSRALRGTMRVTRSAAEAGRVSADQRADMDQLATYDEDHARPRAASMRVDAPAAAATPPAQSEPTPLSPTETSYVQAWLKASARNR